MSPRAYRDDREAKVSLRMRQADARRLPASRAREGELVGVQDQNVPVNGKPQPCGARTATRPWQLAHRSPRARAESRSLTCCTPVVNGDRTQAF
eukprot:4295881-Prymnesium_polylepis.1